MKSIIITLLLINTPIPDGAMLRAVKEDISSYSQSLGFKAVVKIKSVSDVICQSRYSAWGIYSGSPAQSYYYRKCLERYTKDTYKTLNHAVVPPFLYDGKPSMGGYSPGCFKYRGGISISAFGAWNYLGSILALIHEIIHHLNGSHQPGANIMNPDAGGLKYTNILETTKKEVNRCLS